MHSVCAHNKGVKVIFKFLCVAHPFLSISNNEITDEMHYNRKYLFILLLHSIVLVFGNLQKQISMDEKMI